MLLEARGQYAREERPRLANDPTGTSVQTVIGNYGTVTFLPNKQYDWRGQGALQPDVAHRRAQREGRHRVQPRLRQPDVRLQPVRRASSSRAPTRPRSSTSLSTGGAIANRFDSSDVTYQRQLGNLQLDFPTDEIALLRAGQLEAQAELHPQLRPAVGRRVQPDARHEQRVHDERRAEPDVPGRHRTSIPRRFPTRWAQFAPRLGFAWDLGNDGRTVVRGYSGVYYARTPALVYASPMNNFRVPPGDLSLQLPFARAGEQSEQDGLPAAER